MLRTHGPICCIAAIVRRGVVPTWVTIAALLQGKLGGLTATGADVPGVRLAMIAAPTWLVL